MSNNLREFLEKEWDALNIESELEYADDFAKNHNERL